MTKHRVKGKDYINVHWVIVINYCYIAHGEAKDKIIKLLLALVILYFDLVMLGSS